MTRAINETDFRRGYYLAVANLIRTNDQPGMAAELLKEYGPISLRGIDETDRAILKKLITDEMGLEIKAGKRK